MTPKVVVCTPTYNRGWAMEFSVACMKHQIMKPDLWIVVDNSDDISKSWDRICDETYDAGVPVRYVRMTNGKNTVAELRNECLEHALRAGAEYILFWDDDDYYPSERIEHAVTEMEKNPSADIGGSSLMHLLLIRENVMITTGPFSDNHATGATWIVRRNYAEKHRFDPTKTRGEEVTFTKGWAAKMLQLDSKKTIVVMGHHANTVDKSQILNMLEMFRSKIENNANGRMMFRVQWNVSPELWGLFRSTFSV